MTTHAFAPRFDLSNVFMPARDTYADTQETSADATEQTFALVKNGPPVSAEEVESHIDAVEVTVRWGSQVLSVKHLENGKSFFVGEGADLSLPEDIVGAARVAIVESRNGGTYVMIPRGARGTVARKGGQSDSIMNAGEIALEYGMTVTLEVGAVRADGTTGEPITFEVTTVRAGKVAPIGFLAALAGGATGFIGLSFLGHAAIVASLAMFMPKMATDDNDAMDRDQMMLMQKFLSASAEREQEQAKQELANAAEATGGGSTGEPHKGESGAAGTPKAASTSKGHMGFKGTDAAPALSPKTERELAATFGMIGLMSTGAKTDPNAPASPWAKEFAGSDDRSAKGALAGNGIDDAFGFGLGLSGNGEGGGGTSEGSVGIDGVGTIGGGGGGTGKWGIGKGDKDGIGNGHGPGAGGHVAKAPILRNPSLETNGRLPAEVIQRVVRLNFGRFRLCYEAGLRGNPSLTGRVATKFVIGRDGTVATASDAGSDLPDQQVVACVIRGFQNLTFPAPEGGIATVTYPILLSPGQ